ncbi:MAG: ATP-binding protein [Anaerolineae bacterium]
MELHALTLEDFVRFTLVPALLFTGFQESKHWDKEKARYHDLAEVARQVVIFAHDIPAGVHSGPVCQVTLQDDDPLRSEWILLLLSKQKSVVLCGLDKETATADESERLFKTIWSFEPAVIMRVMDELVDILDGYDPARAAEVRAAREEFAPQPPNVDVLVHVFTELINYEEQLQHRFTASQSELERINAELEQRVAERTQELRDLNAHLVELGNLKDDFIANVSHELRTPVASIKLYHYLLRTNPDELDKYITTLERETHRLEMLVEDLLLISRLDRDMVPLDVSDFDLGTIVDQLVTDRRHIAAERTIELAFYNQVTDLSYRGDEVLLARAFGILLTNALNYTPAGGHITIRLVPAEHEGRSQVIIRVEDTGPGVPPREAGQIFERFFRGTNTRHVEGTGLGLPIAREIVTKHGGDLRLASSSPQGSVFEIWLPLPPLN